MESLKTFLNGLKPLFVSKGRLKAFDNEECIFYKDDPGDKVYLIEKGIVKIINYSEDGKELVFAILHDGDIFGEMSVFDKKPRSACAITVGSSKIYELESRLFLNYLKENPDMLLEIIKILSERIRDTNNFAEDTVFLNLSNRILNRLVKISEHCGINRGSYIEIPHSFSQKELAAIVGCSRENLNKELKILKDAGIIDYDKSGIKIFNVYHKREV
ncbi:MAG: Crp/Fnr family transcriptional regulator [bacterium]